MLRRCRNGVLCGVVLLTSQAASPADLGARVGYYTEIEEPFVGAELVLRVGDSVFFNPNVEYVLVDQAEYFTLNADVYYEIAGRGSTHFWLGAGLGLVFVDPEGVAERQEDAAVNFLVGIGLSRGPVVPYFQAKVIAKDDTEFSVGVGLRF
jgi:hypothetical protein